MRMGNLLIYSAAAHSCIWQRARPRCRRCRGSRGRKATRRGRCALSSHSPPGGTFDIMARLIGQWLTEKLGQPFVIENRPGAGANIATEAVVRAPPDGPPESTRDGRPGQLSGLLIASSRKDVLTGLFRFFAPGQRFPSKPR